MNFSDPKCPISGNTMQFWLKMPIDCKTGNQIEYSNVYQCPECGYGAVIPCPEPAAIASFYDLSEYYTQGKGHFADSGAISFFDRLRLHLAWRFDKGVVLDAQWIDKFLKGKSINICELGCGNGQLLKPLSQMGHNVIGVEPDPKAIAFDEELKIYQGTAENLPHQILSQTFDLVIMKHVLEHCYNPIKVLKNVYSLLRPGGYFICEVPNNNSKSLNSSGVTWEMLDIPRHLHFFTPSNLQTFCIQSGFEVEKLLFRGYCREFTNNWINTEATIFERIVNAKIKPEPFPKKNSKYRAWKLFFSTFLASKEKKYDSVAVVAKKS